jgi:hypothetical protein
MASLLAVDCTACQQSAFTCSIAVTLSASWRCCSDHRESLVSWMISDRIVQCLCHSTGCTGVGFVCVFHGQWISAEVHCTLCVFSIASSMLCSHEMCVAPFDIDMHLEKVNMSACTVFRGGMQMIACALYFHPVYFV